MINDLFENIHPSDLVKKWFPFKEFANNNSTFCIIIQYNWAIRYSISHNTDIIMIDKIWLFLISKISP